MIRHSNDGSPPRSVLPWAFRRGERHDEIEDRILRSVDLEREAQRKMLFTVEGKCFVCRQRKLCVWARDARTRTDGLVCLDCRRERNGWALRSSPRRRLT